jgi:hypothetical protein
MICVFINIHCIHSHWGFFSFEEFCPEFVARAFGLAAMSFSSNGTSFVERWGG